MNVLQILMTYHQAFLQGLWVTLELAGLVWASGIVLGTALALLSQRYASSIGIPCRVFSFVLGGVPILVFLFWLHYPAQATFNLVIDPFYTAAFTFSVINIFAVCDLVRGALSDFPEEYLIAAKVTGLSPRQTFSRIQLPLIVRRVLPGLLLLQVAMLHTTLFASLISVEEIFRIAQRINAQIYRPVEIYTALGVFFLAVCLPVNGVAFWLKRRFMRDLSER